MPVHKGIAGGSGSGSGGSPVEVVINHADDSIRIGDGTNTATITTAGAKKALDVNVVDVAIDQATDSIRIGDGTNLAGTTTFGGLKITGSGGWESRQFRANLSYNFGNNQVKSARQRKTSLDDAKDRIN